MSVHVLELVKLTHNMVVVIPDLGVSQSFDAEVMFIKEDVVYKDPRLRERLRPELPIDVDRSASLSGLVYLCPWSRWSGQILGLHQLHNARAGRNISASDRILWWSWCYVTVISPRALTPLPLPLPLPHTHLRCPLT
ncbi:hypothetical protein J6590_004789 [Homalodisca vitripennis]|nr:hypothetical protein J6590_004789 [Homalodisca vitripennis]